MKCCSQNIHVTDLYFISRFDLQSGQNVHLGHGLTTPSSSYLKRSPALTLDIQEGRLVTIHREVVRSRRRREAWEQELPEPLKTVNMENGDEANDIEKNIHPLLKN